MNDLGALPAFAWDGEMMATREFRGDFHLSVQRQLSVGFGSEQAGGSFRRSETRLSGAQHRFTSPAFASRRCPAVHSGYDKYCIVDIGSTPLPAAPHSVTICVGAWQFIAFAHCQRCQMP